MERSHPAAADGDWDRRTNGASSARAGQEETCPATACRAIQPDRPRPERRDPRRRHRPTLAPLRPDGTVHALALTPTYLALLVASDGARRIGPLHPRRSSASQHARSAGGRRRARRVAVGAGIPCRSIDPSPRRAGWVVAYRRHKQICPDRPLCRVESHHVGRVRRRSRLWP
jgi:hypothetical protein